MLVLGEIPISFMMFNIAVWINDDQVRFFYSFTCSENLYLVMEYLNGGDLYSLLRNMGCLDEDMVRTYIAEIVSVEDICYIYLSRL